MRGGYGDSSRHSPQNAPSGSGLFDGPPSPRCCLRWELLFLPPPIAQLAPGASLLWGEQWHPPPLVASRRPAGPGTPMSQRDERPIALAGSSETLLTLSRRIDLGSAGCLAISSASFPSPTFAFGLPPSKPMGPHVHDVPGRCGRFRCPFFFGAVHVLSARLVPTKTWGGGGLSRVPHTGAGLLRPHRSI